MELDRRFSEWTDKDSPSESFLLFAADRNSLGWPDLLKRRRVVVLAEAGSGKSTEFKSQADKLAAMGSFSFRTTVRGVAERGFEASLSAAQRAELARWKASTEGEAAWFFLDSVDEAKARGCELESALSSVGDAIAGAERRAHVLLSGRPSDWEFRRDLALLNEHLMIPEEPAPAAPLDPNVLVVNAVRGVKAPTRPDPEGPIVAIMRGLDERRVELFAAAEGISPTAPFFQALSRKNLLSFARRPLDLQWLVQHWRANGDFGTLREMIALSLNERLKEMNPSLSRVDDLAPGECNSALNRVGAALVLGRLDSILVPDGGVDLARSDDSLDLADILDGWSGAGRTRLISRAAFDPARAGTVRLHNDNEGMVRTFLAARWLASLLAANCPRWKVAEILFADIYGRRVVRPSMRETAAWLSIDDAEIAREVVEIDPWLLLDSADPGSLSVDVRSRALRAALQASESRRRAGHWNHDALRRLAKEDMAVPIRALWTEFKGEPAARQLLLQLVWLGKLTACADLVVESSFGAYTDRMTQMLSARAIVAAGSDADKLRYGEHLAEHMASMETEVFWDGVGELFPRWFTVPELIGAIENADLRAKANAEHLSRNGRSLAEKLETAAEARALLSALASIVIPELLRDEAHPLLDMAEACAAKLLEFDPAAVPAKDAIDVFVAGSKSDRRRHMPGTGRSIALFEALNATPARRRAVFWAAADALSSAAVMGGRPVTSPDHLEFFGIRLGYTPADANWLAEDTLARQRDSDIELAVNAGMRIWRDQGRPHDVLASFQGIAKSNAVAASALAAWISPPAPRPEEQVAHAHVASMIARHESEAKSAADSWKEFADALRADPQQLRSCRPTDQGGVDSRLYHLAHLLDTLHGTRSKYSNTDLSPLVPLFGETVVAEFASALTSQWRNWKPTLQVDRPLETRNTFSMQDLLGLTGVSVEAASTLGWPNEMSDDDAALATAYATLEINGLPEWLGPLCDRNPGAVRRVLLHCIDAEWAPNAQEVRRTLLDDLPRSTSSACRLVAPAILEKIASAPPESAKVLDPALKILARGLEDRAALASRMLARFRAEADVELRALYLGAAFAADGAAASVEFDATLSSLDAAQRKALVEMAMPQIFGGDWASSAVDVDAFPMPILRRLVDVAYREISTEQDIARGSGQVYSPGIRDHAETARSRAFRALVERPGAATFETIQKMASSGLPIDPTFVERLLAERAAIDSESAPWTPASVASFERDFTATPRTPRDLQSSAINRLIDLQRRLDGDDANQGSVLAAFPTEVDVQNWFLNEFRFERRLSFSIEREPHVANEKEPDLRMQARATTAKLPIEIKVAGSWSRVQLEAALTEQLMGRYLLDRENRWGILLIVCQAKRRRGWRMPDGSYAQIAGVVEHLRRMALEIASKDSDAAQMAIQLIDVSGFKAEEEEDEQE